ncbi:MAG TPA: pyridoxal-dependent decarboxylase [Agromyces sp.]
MSDVLNARTADQYAALIRRTTDRLAERVRSSTRPHSGAPIRELRDLTSRIDLDGDGIGSRAALDEADELFTEHAVWFHTPGYLAHLNCPVAVPAVAAEAIIAAVNPSLDTFDQSRAGTLMEQRLIEWTARRIGFAAGDGVFTSGGTQSNLQALFLAREHALRTQPGSRAELMPRLSILATASSHFSVGKSALLLGLAEDAVELVPTDAHGRMDAAALDQTIDALSSAGRIPMAITATAGTTDRGVIDPLADIAVVAEAQRVWLHVDAAYGCGLLVSPTRRVLLAGIERAQSVTVDFHKAFLQPVSSSALIVSDPASLAAVAWHADYLNPLENDEPNQVDKSMQTTRRFDALKLWVTLRALGADRLGVLFDRVLDLTQAVHEHVTRDPALRLASPTQLSTVLFRYQPDGMPDRVADALVSALREALLADGRVLIAKTVIDGRPTLKLTLLNPETTLAEVAAALAVVAGFAETIAASHSESLADPFGRFDPALVAADEGAIR